MDLDSLACIQEVLWCVYSACLVGSKEMELRCKEVLDIKFPYPIVLSRVWEFPPFRRDLISPILEGFQVSFPTFSLKKISKHS